MTVHSLCLCLHSHSLGHPILVYQLPYNVQAGRACEESARRPKDGTKCISLRMKGDYAPPWLTAYKSPPISTLRAQPVEADARQGASVKTNLPTTMLVLVLLSGHLFRQEAKTMFTAASVFL